MNSLTITMPDKSVRTVYVYQYITNEGVAITVKCIAATKEIAVEYLAKLYDKKVSDFMPLFIESIFVVN